jgi:hypothetical protein
MNVSHWVARAQVTRSLAAPARLLLELDPCDGICDVPQTWRSTARGERLPSPHDWFQAIERAHASGVLAVAVAAPDLLCFRQDGARQNGIWEISEHVNNRGMLLAFHTALGEGGLLRLSESPEKTADGLAEMGPDMVLLYASPAQMGLIGTQIGVLHQRLLQRSLCVVVLHTQVPETDDERGKILAGVSAMRETTKGSSLNLCFVAREGMSVATASSSLRAVVDSDPAVQALLKPPIPPCARLEWPARVWAQGVCPAVSLLVAPEPSTPGVRACLRSLGSMPTRELGGSGATGLPADCALRTDCPTCEAWHLCQGGCGVWRT